MKRLILLLLALTLSTAGAAVKAQNTAADQSGGDTAANDLTSAATETMPAPEEETVTNAAAMDSEEDDAAAGYADMGVAYICTHNDRTRRIEVDLLSPPQAVPCEVNYYKDTEVPGGKNTLWTANNDASYCNRKAKDLMEKLEVSNWSCTTR